MKQEFNEDTLLVRWLSDELTPEELEAFKKREDFDALVQLKEKTARLQSPEYDQEAEWSALEAKISKAPVQIEKQFVKLRRLLPIISAAAAVLLLFGYFLFSPSPITELVVKDGEIERHIFPDGSAVEVIGPAQISYNRSTFTEARDLNFTGTGFFEVEPGSKFLVTGDLGSVLVLGTSFNAILSDSLVDIRCYTGKVKAITSSDEQELEPGMGARISNDAQDAKFDRFDFYPAASPSWKSGRIVYKDYSIEQVIQELEWTFNVTIEHVGLEKKSVSGAFPDDNLEEALRLAFDHLNIKYEIVNESLVRLSGE